MSELSPEASVAAQAAADAVEELHKREEVENHAVEAAVTAQDALSVASQAEGQAETAAAVSVAAGEAAVNAGEQAGQARQAAESANDVGSRAFAKAEALENEMARIRQLLEERLPAEPEADEVEEQVTEVPVEDGTKTAGTSNTPAPGNQGNAPAASTPQASGRHHGFRRGRR